MFFTEAKFRRSVIELGEKRYFGHTCIAPFTAMEGQLSQDESNVSIPEKIEGSSFDLNDSFVGRDRYLWLEKNVTIPEAMDVKWLDYLILEKPEPATIVGLNLCCI